MGSFTTVNGAELGGGLFLDSTASSTELVLSVEQRAITIDPIVTVTADVCLSHTTLMTISNTGSGGVAVSAMDLDDSEFTISETLPFTIVAGSSQAVTLTFAPARAGLDRLTVSITHDAADDLIVDLEHDRAGPIWMVGPMVRFRDAPRAAQGVSPPLGRDSAAILDELGYDAARVLDLQARDIIG